LAHLRNFLCTLLTDDWSPSILQAGVRRRRLNLFGRNLDSLYNLIYVLSVCLPLTALYGDNWLSKSFPFALSVNHSHLCHGALTTSVLPLFASSSRQFPRERFCATLYLKSGKHELPKSPSRLLVTLHFPAGPALLFIGSSCVRDY